MTQKDSTEAAISREKCSVFTSCRWMVAHVCFLGTAAMFALRQTISMALVCMFPEKGGESGAHDNNITGDCQTASSNHTPALDWSDELQGLVLSAHSYGYLFSPIFGGYVASRYGGKQVMLVNMTLAVIATVLIPVVALHSVYGVIALRVIVGLSFGPVAPAMQEILNRWAPSSEKSKLLSFSYAGSNVGNVVAYSFSGFICTIPVLGGWPLVFYIFGGATLLWVLWSLCFIYNTPEDHPRISKYEKRYVMNGIPTSYKQKVPRPPLRLVLTSVPLLACLFCQFVNATTQIVAGSVLPLYMRDVLNYPVEQNGLFSALPSLGRFCGMLLAGYLMDYVVRKDVLSLSGARKLFLATGYLIPAACIFGVSFLDESRREWAVVIFVVMATASAFAMITLRINITDIAPRYASVLVGVLMAVNGVPGIVVPVSVTVITADGTREQWQIVFMIASALYVVATLLFAVFGSADEQPWAKYERLDQEEIIPD